jgi:regulator of protease activity HflC (stomatin/prohibitin superfamily)
VAIVPTTINRLRFVADQITREKVGVQVTGLAVYRIVEPEIAFRMLNFSFGERASQKLADILREMFVGAVRRHVANLTVEEVITRRKESIAHELVTELSPVIEGEGRADDSTNRGWGVVLDSVEIQDVRVQSETVFRDMQAEFRAQLATRARQAELARAEEIALKEASSSRAIEQARLSSDVAMREARAQAESRSVEVEVAEASRRAALEAKAASEQSRREHARELASVQQRTELEASQHALARGEAEMEAELARQRATAAAERAEAESVATARLRERELELERRAQDVESARQARHHALLNDVSAARIQQLLVEKGLPALAEAFSQDIGELRITNLGGDATDPATMVTRGIAGALDLLRTMVPGESGAGG